MITLSEFTRSVLVLSRRSDLNKKVGGSMNYSARSAYLKKNIWPPTITTLTPHF